MRPTTIQITIRAQRSGNHQFFKRAQYNAGLMLARHIARGRRRRFYLFLQHAPRARPLRVLDVGGTWAYWASMPWAYLTPGTIELLNQFPQDVPPPFTAVVGDARDLSRYPDEAFDFVLSHSVIGHVGSFEDQERMAHELLRVGRCIVLQTPNQDFPIDWRTLVPAFHWLPLTWQAWCLTYSRVGAYPRAATPGDAWAQATHVRNLRKSELQQLFPGATIHHERVCGWTKSFVVTTEAGR